MKFGLPVSLFLHTVVIGGTMISLGRPAVLDAERRTIPVQIVNLSELTTAPTPAPRPSPQPEPEDDPALPTDDPEEPTVDANSAEADDGDPPPEETATENTDDPADTKPQRRSLDDITKMAANTAQGYEGSGTPQTTQTEQNAQAAGQAAAGSELSASYEDAIMRVVYNQWTIPSGAPDMESLVVSMRVKLAPNRRVESLVLIPDSARLAATDPYFKTAADRAKRAVYASEPFDFLPRAQYAKWKDLELTFYPKNASGISEE